MGKKHKKGRNRQKARPKRAVFSTPPRQSTLRWLRILSPTGWLWTSVSLVAALVSSYYLLRPQIEVEPDTALDPKSPMTTPFRITNRGVLPIYNLRKRCDIRKLETKKGQLQSLNNLFVEDATEPTIPRLNPGESTSVFVQLHIQFETPFVNGDVDVEVEYTTPFVGTHKKQHYRFETRKDINNEFRWYHKSSSE